MFCWLDAWAWYERHRSPCAAVTPTALLTSCAEWRAQCAMQSPIVGRATVCHNHILDEAGRPGTCISLFHQTLPLLNQPKALPPSVDAPSPTDLVIEVCRAAKASGESKSRFVNRLYPVDVVGFASLEKIEELAAKVVEQHFGERAQPVQVCIM